MLADPLFGIGKSRQECTFTVDNRQRHAVWQIMVRGKLIDPIDIQSRKKHRLQMPLIIDDRIAEIYASPRRAALNLIIAYGEGLRFARLAKMAGCGDVLAV